MTLILAMTSLIIFAYLRGRIDVREELEEKMNRGKKEI